MDNELEFYYDRRFDTVFAYGRFCEFFEVYDKKSKKWQTSPVSYSMYLHDYYEGNVISSEQAAKFTDGNLPYKAYEEYCKLFK